MRPLFDVPVLEGSLVRLEPLSECHAEDLTQNQDRYEREDNPEQGSDAADEIGDVCHLHPPRQA